ncbi:hypothetical protein EDC01DRAFT_654116 [Geopyxis carbonaria]|nr:hypothetical protein EDC01DRAFT_654116 [Geopyxis carbonaria]
MPANSKLTPISPPTQDLYSFIFDQENRAFPDDKVIYIDGKTDRSLNFGEIRDQAKAFGIGLKSMWGWKKGDVLCVFSTNQIDTPPLTWGTIWASGVVTPANPAYTVGELTFQLKDSGAKAIATIPSLIPTAVAAATAAGIPEDRILIIGDKRTRPYKHWRELIDPSTSVKWRKGKFDVKKDVAFLVYSSGTTGLPKGVMLSHQNITSNVLQLIAGERDHLTGDDRVIAFLPFFHIYGLTCIVHQNVYVGRQTIVMERFDMEIFCQLTEKHKITYAYVVPPVILLLAKHPLVAKYDLSSIRMLNSGAAPLTKELVGAVWERLKLPTKQGYGLSETAPTTHTQDWDDWQTKIGSVGDLLPSLTVKYLDEEGNEVPIGETGEICLKGPNVMLGYLNNKAATANAFTSDGFFKTGDIGYEDKDGHVYVTDRVKELIKYKGFQVAPAELEGKLMGHEKVADAAVIGVYEEEIASEVPRAYIVPNPGVERGGLEKELTDWIEGRVAHYKRLRGGIKFVDSIPKSASGKILRRLLKEQAKNEVETIKAKL